MSDVFVSSAVLCQVAIHKFVAGVFARACFFSCVVRRCHYRSAILQKKHVSCASWFYILCLHGQGRRTSPDDAAFVSGGAIP